MVATSIGIAEWALPLGSAVLGLLIVGALGTRVRKLQGTTLIAPCIWAIFAVFAVVTSEIVTIFSDAGWCEPTKYATAVATFCPQMALLGAKRPQNKAWHFVVVTLWAVLVLPAFEAIVFHSGQTLDVKGMRSWFLLVLVLMGVANSLPTRFWLSAVLVAAGQSLLLWNYLPMGNADLGSAGVLIASFTFLAAIGAAAMTRSKRLPAEHPLDRVWIDFRDWFGTLWGLRVAERINAAASMYDWPFRLTWSGFRACEAADGPIIPDADLEVLETAMTNLLRRFVSPEWIAKRMGQSID
ncbi:MAG: hypothetical protein IH991_10405 [Planctomycetes bacterium]|nr:hypothetical protein [Planctomycetota bacterium]